MDKASPSPITAQTLDSYDSFVSSVETLGFMPLSKNAIGFSKSSSWTS